MMMMMMMMVVVVVVLRQNKGAVAPTDFGLALQCSEGQCFFDDDELSSSLSKAESGSGVLGDGSASHLTTRCELQEEFGAEPRPPKGFPLFPALQMASPGLSRSH